MITNGDSIRDRNGIAGYVYLVRPIQSSKNVFNFRIVESITMDIHIGIELNPKFTDPHERHDEHYEWRYQL